LGRKAFVPARPVALALPPQGAGGIRQDMDLIDALRAEPWRRHAGVPHRHPDPTRLRCAIEVDDPRGTERRMDQPGPGAAFAHRHFLPRFVRTDFWQLGADVEKGAPSDV
jgi:hypothetical protein